MLGFALRHTLGNGLVRQAFGGSVLPRTVTCVQHTRLGSSNAKSGPLTSPMASPCGLLGVSGMATRSSVSLRLGAGLLTQATSGLWQTQTAIRHSSVFTSESSATRIWDGVVSVRAAGKKRGRAKRGSGRRMVDLNRGQEIGSGRSGHLWPGLNAPVIRGRTAVLEAKVGKRDTGREEKMREARTKQQSFRLRRSTPLERGWTSATIKGQSIGAPDPIGDFLFDSFDSRVLDVKTVCHMESGVGRVRAYWALVAVGNGSGLAGFCFKKAPLGRAALRLSKNSAAQRLEHFELKENRTLFHNAYHKEGGTKVYMEPRPPGYGLKCHRVITDLSRLVGIRDMYAKVEGAVKNPLAITRAFFQILRTQETSQVLADRQRLHVVEFRSETDFYPVLLASPRASLGTAYSPQRVTAQTVSRDGKQTTKIVESRDERPVVPTREVDEEEDRDVERHYWGGHVLYRKPRPLAFVKRLPGWQVYLKRAAPRRNQRSARILRQVYEQTHGLPTVPLHAVELADERVTLDYARRQARKQAQSDN